MMPKVTETQEETMHPKDVKGAQPEQLVKPTIGDSVATWSQAYDALATALSECRKERDDYKRNLKGCTEALAAANNDYGERLDEYEAALSECRERERELGERAASFLGEYPEPHHANYSPKDEPMRQFLGDVAALAAQPPSEVSERSGT